MLTENLNSLQRFLLRFFIVYFLLYTLPFPLGWIPFLGSVSEFYMSLWEVPVRLAAKFIFGISNEVSNTFNGSGDTTFSFIRTFLIFVISVIVSGVWAAIDVRTTSLQKLFSFASVWLRYYLAFLMLSYGFMKVFHLQFPFPSISRLQTTYGESSPMGLLWTFMGYSPAYNFFTGMCEVVGGMLLFFRRTRMLGCVVVVAVMTNVAMLNFTYDVPVKLLSVHLLAMSIFLLTPDFRKLVNFFLLHKAVEPEPEIVPFKSNRMFYITAKTLIIGALIVFQIASSIDRYVDVQKSIATLNNASIDTGVPGLYKVDTFVIGGDTLPPVANDTRRWEKLSLNSNSRSEVYYMDGASVLWKSSVDLASQTITLSSFNNANMISFRYKAEGQNLFLEGILNDKPLTVSLTKQPPEFLLVNRGFNWINESPYNR